MAPLKFDDLLKQMPAVAKAVNAFGSEAVQQQAFAVLLRALRGEDLAETENEIVKSEKKSRLIPRRRRGITKGEGAGKASLRPKRGKTTPTIVSDLNLRPKGKESLKDFMAKKSPKDNQEALAAIVYYLQKILSLKNIGQNHVYTGFKDIGKRTPSNLQVALSLTSTRKGWINTRDMSDLKMTVPGENFVEHDLPKKKAVKSK